MSQTFCSTLLLIPLLLESSASSSGSAASRFQFRFGAPLGRFRMDLGAPPERVAAKDKVAGCLALHVVPEEWQEAAPRNQNTFQPTISFSIDMDAKRDQQLGSLWDHFGITLGSLRIDMSLNFCCTLLLICSTAVPFHCRCISTGPI